MIDNVDFNIIDSELKAYLVGIFYADATLTNYCITFRLSYKDKEFVTKIAKFFDKEVFIRDVKNKSGKIYKSAGFNFCNKEQVENLKKIGFIKNKTYQIDDIVFKNIPDIYKKDFIRGFFDGDGTIFYSKYNRNINWNESERCSIGFVSYNSKILETIKDFLTIQLGLNDKSLKSDNFEDIKKNERYWRLIYNGNRISKKILDFLYEGSTIFMDRKYQKYLRIKIFEPKGYHFHKRDNAWRVPYKDENNIRRWKNFKTEIDAQEFLQTKNKIKRYEKFIS